MTVEESEKKGITLFYVLIIIWLNFKKTSWQNEVIKYFLEQAQQAKGSGLVT